MGLLGYQMARTIDRAQRSTDRSTIQKETPVTQPEHELADVPIERPVGAGQPRSTLILPGDADNVLLCTKCRQPMPDLPDELVAMARAAGGAVLAHDVCPGETADQGRYFEVRVQIVEVTEPQGDEPVIAPYVNGSAEQNARRDALVTELVSFRHGLRAVDLDAAMRPLALGLGEKWQKAERQAKVADSL